MSSQSLQTDRQALHRQHTLGQNMLQNDYLLSQHTRGANFGPDQASVLENGQISSRGPGATDFSVLCNSWATTFCLAVCLFFTGLRAVIHSVRLPIAVACVFENIIVSQT